MQPLFYFSITLPAATKDPFILLEDLNTALFVATDDKYLSLLLLWLVRPHKRLPPLHTGGDASSVGCSAGGSIYSLYLSNPSDYPFADILDP